MSNVWDYINHGLAGLSPAARQSLLATGLSLKQRGVGFGRAGLAGLDDYQKLTEQARQSAFENRRVAAIESETNLRKQQFDMQSEEYKRKREEYDTQRKAYGAVDWKSLKVPDAIAGLAQADPKVAQALIASMYSKDHTNDPEIWTPLPDGTMRSSRGKIELDPRSDGKPGEIRHVRTPDGTKLQDEIYNAQSKTWEPKGGAYTPSTNQLAQMMAALAGGGDAAGGAGGTPAPDNLDAYIQAGHAAPQPAPTPATTPSIVPPMAPSAGPLPGLGGMGYVQPTPPPDPTGGLNLDPGTAEARKARIRQMFGTP